MGTFHTEDGGYNALPTEAKEALAKVISEAHNHVK